MIDPLVVIPLVFCAVSVGFNLIQLREDRRKSEEISTLERANREYYRNEMQLNLELSSLRSRNTPVRTELRGEWRTFDSEIMNPWLIPESRVSPSTRVSASVSPTASFVAPQPTAEQRQAFEEKINRFAEMYGGGPKKEKKLDPGFWK